MYSAILNGIVGVHIDKRVAIGTRSANQNPEFRRICRGVPFEARPYAGLALPFANCAKCAEIINVALYFGHWLILFAKKKSIEIANHRSL